VNRVGHSIPARTRSHDGRRQVHCVLRRKIANGLGRTMTNDPVFPQRSPPWLLTTAACVA
jgi:hypothetical protein